MGRYNDINRGPELKKAYDERQAWLQKSADQKATAYKSVAKPRTDRVRPERIIAYVRPFNITKEGVYYEARGLSATQVGAGATIAGTARTLVGTRVVYDAPAGPADTIIPITRYKFAKVNVTLRTGNADENAKSRITGRPYTRYRTDSISSVFGRLTGDANYQDAVQKIKDSAAYKAFVATVGNRIGFTPEG